MEKRELEIVMISGACCVPSLAKMEKELESRLRRTLADLESAAAVRVVSLGAVLAGDASISEEQANLIRALFQKYGARVAPAALLGPRVLFAGGAPAQEKLTTLLEAIQ